MRFKMKEESNLFEDEEDDSDPIEELGLDD